MSKSYLPFDPTQQYLLPPSPEDWLREGHLAYFVRDLVSTLDLRALFAHYERDHRGAPPHHPVMMMGLLVYAYCVGIPSSRKIERKTYEDVAFRVIAANNHPDHTRISEFRRIHAQVLESLFVQVLQLCQKAGLVSLGHVSLDGTKLKANASKHKAMSYGHMKQQESALKEKVQQLLAAAEAADSEEDARIGKGLRGDEMPKELQRAQNRLAAIQAAKAELEAEAKAAAEAEALEKEKVKAKAAAEATAKAAAEAAAMAKAAAEAAAMAKAAAEATTKAVAETTARVAEAEAAAAKAQAAEVASRAAAEAATKATAQAERAEDAKEKSDPPSESSKELPSHQVPHRADGTPTDKAQRNFTDPDSRIQKTGDGYVQGYNGQAVVDEKSQVIVAQALTNQAPDVEHLVPLLEQMVANCGLRPERMSADAGYFSEANAGALAELGIEAFVPPRREKHGQAPLPCGDQPPPTAKARDRMTYKLKTPRGRTEYAKRKGIVEPVFGQIKEGRGFRQLLRRGLDAARSEWSFICTTHNLLKLFRAGGVPA